MNAPGKPITRVLGSEVMVVRGSLSAGEVWWRDVLPEMVLVGKGVLGVSVERDRMGRRGVKGVR